MAIDFELVANLAVSQSSQLSTLMETCADATFVPDMPTSHPIDPADGHLRKHMGFFESGLVRISVNQMLVTMSEFHHQDFFTGLNDGFRRWPNLNSCLDTAEIPRRRPLKPYHPAFSCPSDALLAGASRTNTTCVFGPRCYPTLRVTWVSRLDGVMLMLSAFQLLALTLNFASR